MHREHTREMNRLWRVALAIICAVALAVPASFATLAARPHQAWAEDTTTSIPLTGAAGEEAGSNSSAPTILGIRLTQSFCVTFDADGGSGSVHWWVRDGEALSKRAYTGVASGPTTGTAQAMSALPTDPVRAGYSFRGWYATDASGNITGDRLTTAVLAQAVTANVTYKAKWLVNHTVTFDPNGEGAKVDAGAAFTQTVADGERATLPATPTLADHSFMHWYVDAGSATLSNAAYDFSTPVTSDITLKARWKSATKVYFYGNGGTLAAGTVSPVSVGEGDVVAEPPAPTRAGYAFEYWFSSVEGGTPSAADATTAYNFNTPVTELRYLYAKWTPLSYKITYDDSCYTKDGAFAVASGEPVTSYRTSTAATVVNWTPVRDGYAFTGWTASGAYTLTTPTKTLSIPANTTGAIKLTANWASTNTTFDLTGDPATGSNADAPTTLAIRLKAGDDTYATDGVQLVLYPRNGEDASVISYTKGDTIDRPADPASLDGFTFRGWSTSPTTYTAFTFGGTITGDIVLYGWWTPHAVSTNPVVTFVVPAHTSSTNIDVAVDQYWKVSAPSFPAGSLGIYAVEGYYTTPDYIGTPWNFDDVVAEDMTLYAKCVTTVTLHANGGTIVASGWTLTPGTTDYTQTYVYSATAGLVIPADTTGTDVKRADWAFLNWCTDDELTTPIAKPTGSSGTTTVTIPSDKLQAEYWAKWDPLITVALYKFADDEGAYTGATTIAASDATTQLTLPSTEPAMAGGTAASGLAGHKLAAWYVPAATETIVDKVDADASTTGKRLALGQVCTLSDLTSGATEPTTVKLYAAWEATVGATMPVAQANFFPDVSLTDAPVTEVPSQTALSVSSTTPRGLALTAQSLPMGTQAGSDGADEAYDMTGAFQKLFKATDATADVQQLMSQAYFHYVSGTGAAVTGITEFIPYMSYSAGSASAGSVASVGHLTASDGSTATTVSGTLKLTLPTGMRTLFVRESEALSDGTGGYVGDAITKLRWTVAMSDADAHAYVFTSTAAKHW